MYNYQNLQGTNPCAKFALSPLDLAGIQIILEKYDFNQNKWIRIAGFHYAYSAPYTINNLSKGKYRVKLFKPIMVTTANCQNGRIKVYNGNGQEIGFVSLYDDDPDITSNGVWVGEAEISSADVSFNNQGYNPNAFDSGQVVKVNITSDYKWTGWRGVIRDEQTLEEYETGWQNVNNNQGPFYVSQVWEDGGGDAFKPLHSYKATIWVTNNQCEAWKSYNMPFFICPAGTGCRLQDKELSIDFYPNPATDHIVLQGLDHIHPGDRIEATIVDVIGKVVKNIPNLQKTQISVSDLNSGMYYLSVFRNQKQVSTEKLIIQ